MVLLWLLMVGAPRNTHRYSPFPSYDEQDCLLSFVYELESYM